MTKRKGLLLNRRLDSLKNSTEQLEKAKAQKEKEDVLNALVLYGLNTANANRLNGLDNFRNVKKSYYLEFKTDKKVRATGVGWFKDHLRGELIANIAYSIYCRVAPQNKQLTEEPQPKDILETYRAFALVHPGYLKEVDEERGLDINRLIGLLYKIRSHDTCEGSCSRCDNTFIREASKRLITCPFCALSSKEQKKVSC